MGGEWEGQVLRERQKDSNGLDSDEVPRGYPYEKESMMVPGKGWPLTRRWSKHFFGRIRTPHLVAIFHIYIVGTSVSLTVKWIRV